MMVISSHMIEAAIKEWGLEALTALASLGSEASGYLEQVRADSVRWVKVSHDLETSAHTPDDRDTFVVEGKGDGFTIEITVDVVHDDGDLDRFGHTIFFSIIVDSHEIEGSVTLPLPEDKDTMKPFVNIWGIQNI